MTKEERFIITLYREAKRFGDSQMPMDRYKIGKLIGEKTKSINTICQILTQSNFIKKLEENEIRLTPNGINLAKQLLGE